MAETIYRITNITNGDCYIGKTSDIERRWKQHLRSAKTGSNCHIHNAIRKYGTEHFVIEQIDTAYEFNVNDKERYWIAKLQPRYNMTAGGDGNTGMPLSEETKARISKSMTGRIIPSDVRKRMQHSHQPITAATREKMRQAKVGFIPWNKGKTNCYNKETLMKIGNAATGRLHSTETKTNMSLIKKAFYSTKEGKAVITNRTSTITGRKRHVLPNGKWIYPKSDS